MARQNNVVRRPRPRPAGFGFGPSANWKTVATGRYATAKPNYESLEHDDPRRLRKDLEHEDRVAPKPPATRKEWKHRLKGNYMRLSRSLGRHAHELKALDNAALEDIAVEAKVQRPGVESREIRQLVNAIIRLRTNEIPASA